MILSIDLNQYPIVSKRKKNLFWSWDRGSSRSRSERSGDREDQAPFFMVCRAERI